MSTMQFTEEEYRRVYAVSDFLLTEIGKAVAGKEREIRLLVSAMIAGGHVLIEDVPGVGKTTLAAALAKAAGLAFRRAPFTPDVMASDITGFNLYNRKTESFEFRQGLVNTNVLLADEINRAAPKTQSSLLEAMAEGRVTVDGVTYDLPRPFMVVATQNPAGFVGTYPLPEAQLDRFFLRIRMGYPTPRDELAILRSRREGDPMDSLRSLPDEKAVLLLQTAADAVRLSPEIEEYIVSLVSATRTREEFSLGASPRASLALMKLARAMALLSHRSYVLPEDVADLYPEAVAHRVVLSRRAPVGLEAETVLREILAETPVPFLSRDGRSS